jgi:hypothetical protein
MIMENRWNRFMKAGMISLTVLQAATGPMSGMTVLAAEEYCADEAEPAAASLVAEENEQEMILDESENSSSSQSVSEPAAGASSGDDIQIEGIEVIESCELDENTEDRITSYLEKKMIQKEPALEAQMELEEAEPKAQLPEGFTVDPLQYPQAAMTDNVREIYRYLTEELELNHAAACGVLANIHLESSFRPICFGDSGTSYGICQWHLGRFSHLVSYCREAGLDYNTLEGQLDFLKLELESDYAGVLSYIKDVPDTAQGAYDAAYYWCVYFEMPDQMFLRGQQRGNLARNEYFAQDFTEETTAKKKKTADLTLETDLRRMSDWIFFLDDSVNFDLDTTGEQF